MGMRKLLAMLVLLAKRRIAMAQVISPPPFTEGLDYRCNILSGAACGILGANANCL